MAYTLQTSQADFQGGKTILASEHFQFIEAGATLDAEAFGQGKIEVGTLVGRNTTTGKFEGVAGAEDLENFDNFGILNHDAICNGKDDIIVGEVIIRGSVYEAKLPTEVSDEFKAQTPMIRYVNHV